MCWVKQLWVKDGKRISYCVVPLVCNAKIISQRWGNVGYFDVDKYCNMTSYDDIIAQVVCLQNVYLVLMAQQEEEGPQPLPVWEQQV